MNQLEFLQEWYKSKCDGDWEHTYGIKIETLDNPGWIITIDLEETDFENLVFSESEDISDDNWFQITAHNNKLMASGDPNKLVVLLSRIENILTQSTI